MAVDKLVDSTQLDADLTSVANAIRTKGGTSASLDFPADFVTAIAAIPSGGGGSSVQKGTITGPDNIEMTIPVNGTVSGIVVYTEDYSTGTNYENVCVTAISGYGYFYVGLASALTATRAGTKLEANYAAMDFITFASGSVVLHCRCTGSSSQKWIDGATYKWVAW